MDFTLIKVSIWRFDFKRQKICICIEQWNM